MRIAILFACLFWVSVTTSFADKVVIHFAGEVNKPGSYTVESPIAIDDLIKVCGGVTEFGSTKRLKAVRFARPPSATLGDKGGKSNEVLELDQIPQKEGKLDLSAIDLIYIPVKVIIGR
jgi:protein involved in polysaccharide export with SLBB domain